MSTEQAERVRLGTFEIEDVERELELPFTKQDVEDVLGQEGYQPEQLLGLLERDPFLKTQFERSAGIKEGYSVRTHTSMGSGQLEHYFADAHWPEGTDLDRFRLTYALHDIGKGEAVGRYRKNAQHEFTAPILRAVLERLGYDPDDIRVAVALVNGDPIGSYLQYNNLTAAAEEAARMAVDSGLPFGDFWELLNRFYMVDASSYTVDAGGTEETRLNMVFSFDRERRQMRYDRGVAERVAELKSVAQLQVRILEERQRDRVMRQELEGSLGEYLPSLEQANYPDIAQGLVEGARATEAELERAVDLERQKVGFLEGRNAEPPSGACEEPDGDRLAELRSLAQVLDSHEAYAAFAEVSEAPRMADQAERLRAKYGGTFTLPGTVRGWFQRERHADAVAAANAAARKAAYETAREIVAGIDRQVDDAAAVALNNVISLRAAYRRFRDAVDEEGMRTALAVMEDPAMYAGLASYARLKEIADAVAGMRAPEDGSDGRRMPLVSGYQLSMLEKNAGLSRAFWAQEMRPADMSLQLGETARRLRKEFRSAYEEGPDPLEPRKEAWSMTREFVGALRSLNERLAAVAGMTGVEVAPLPLDSKQLTQAWEISAGRLLTHSAPNELVYKVLATGELGSVAALRSRGEKVQRTHAREEHEDMEVHDISFETDRVYGNLAKPHPGSRVETPPDIAIVLSENDVLSRGCQYVGSADGVHVFDPAFAGERAESPGLRLDLKGMPCMIVTQKERDNFVAFLRSQSAWATEVAGMSESELEEWLSRHVMFVERLADFTGDEATRRRFAERQGLSLRKGHVELMETPARMKVAFWPLMRFVPH